MKSVGCRVVPGRLVVRFEELCDQPAATLCALAAHCRLSDAERIVARQAAGIRGPTTFRSSLSARDLEVTHEETAATAGVWGYDGG